MIRLRDVSKSFPRGGPALERVSFHIRKGEFAFLTGHSGAGKTTILRLVHFQTMPSEGEVRVSRYSSKNIKRRHIPDLRRRVGFVFQDFRLLERLTAEENIAFALEVTGTARSKIGPRVQRLLNQVGLAAKARSLPSELSGGERQRVVVARALATDPLILLADEPTGNLDGRATDGIFELFRTINSLGMAVLMATHDADLLRRHRDVRVLELEHGRLVYDSGSADDVSTARPERKRVQDGVERAENGDERLAGLAPTRASEESEAEPETEAEPSRPAGPPAMPAESDGETVSGADPAIDGAPARPAPERDRELS